MQEGAVLRRREACNVQNSRAPYDVCTDIIITHECLRCDERIRHFCARGFLRKESQLTVGAGFGGQSREVLRTLLFLFFSSFDGVKLAGFGCEPKPGLGHCVSSAVENHRRRTQTGPDYTRHVLTQCGLSGLIWNYCVFPLLPPSIRG